MKNTKKNRLMPESAAAETEEKAGENKISVRRLVSVIFCIAVFLSATWLLCYRERLLIDETVSVLILTFVFLLIFVLSLRHDRLKNRLSYNGTTYRKFVIAFLSAFAVVIFGSYLPDYFFPIVVIALILSSVMDGKLSLALTVYFAALYALTSGAGIYVLLCYIILGCTGALLADYLREEKFTFFIGLILFVLAMFFPAVFQFISFRVLDISFLKSAFASGLVTGLAAWILFPLLVRIDRREPVYAYEMILDEDYHLAQDIRRFSFAEYSHAKRVMTAAGNCAGLVGAKKHTAACGGFYYRLGVMQGAPVVKNGVAAAVDNCFPTDVIQILSEYRAEEKKPSTPESAIVHMTDSVITKLELLDSDTFTSDWNQSMVIYQTLNEFSAKGIYDESGLGINQFLRTRDYLAGHDLLNITDLKTGKG